MSSVLTLVSGNIVDDLLGCFGLEEGSVSVYLFGSFWSCEPVGASIELREMREGSRKIQECSAVGKYVIKDLLFLLLMFLSHVEGVSVVIPTAYRACIPTMCLKGRNERPLFSLLKRREI